MGTGAQVTADLAYVEIDPIAGIQTTADLIYVEIGINEGGTAAIYAQTTALLTYLELDPIGRAETTALLAYVEVEIGNPPNLLIPPAGISVPEVYDEEGRRLGFLGDFRMKRAYVLNQVGSGEATFPADALAVTQSFIDVDHLLLIHSRLGLPDWLGVIMSIEYTKDLVTVNCQEGLVLLSRWNGLGYPIKRYPEGLEEAWPETATPQELISGALQRINAGGESMVRIGAVSLTQTYPVQLEHSLRKTVLDELIELQKVFGFDFWVEPSFASNERRLLVKLYVSDQKGRDQRPNVVLWEGRSLGDGSRYRTYSTQYFHQEIAEMLEVTVTDTSLWPYLQLGDKIGIRSMSLGPLGISKDVRILGMEPDEETGELALAVEVV